MTAKHPKPPTDEAMKARELSEREDEGGAPSHASKPKRPRDDPNQATGEKPDLDPKPEGEGKRAVVPGKKEHH